VQTAGEESLIASGSFLVYSIAKPHIEGARLTSLRKQAVTAIVQQISSAANKQVPSAATLDLGCLTRKRRPRDPHPLPGYAGFRKRAAVCTISLSWIAVGNSCAIFSIIHTQEWGNARNK
jgi:hypothetical protein